MVDDSHGGSNQPSHFGELPTDRLIGPLLTIKKRVSAVAFSPDGKMIVRAPAYRRGAASAGRQPPAADRPTLPQPGLRSGRGLQPRWHQDLDRHGMVPIKGEAQLWDAATGKPIGRPLPHRNDVVAVAFSPDGKRIVTGSMDQTARLWEPPAGNRSERRSCIPQRSAAVAFSPDGKTILTGAGKQVRLWDAAHRKASRRSSGIRGRSRAWPSVPAAKLLPRPAKTGSFSSGMPRLRNCLDFLFTIPTRNGGRFQPRRKASLDRLPGPHGPRVGHTHGSCHWDEPAAPQGRDQRRLQPRRPDHPDGMRRRVGSSLGRGDSGNRRERPARALGRSAERHGALPRGGDANARRSHATTAT